MKKFLLLIALFTVAFIAPLMPVTASAGDTPPDEVLVAALCPRVGIQGGLFLLQDYADQYGKDHPGLDWNQAYPHILNDFTGFWGCGHVILNPGDPNQIAAPIVRILGPSARKLYNSGK